MRIRTYYLSRKTAAVYTEEEKRRSKYPQESFELIGDFENRDQAESAYQEKTGIVPAYMNRRL